jgi:hypothetical protein
MSYAGSYIIYTCLDVSDAFYEIDYSSLDVKYARLDMNYAWLDIGVFGCFSFVYPVSAIITSKIRIVVRKLISVTSVTPYFGNFIISPKTKT